MISEVSWPKYIMTLLIEAEMSYNTTVFWLFLGCFLLGYLFAKSVRSKRNWILVGSIVFYIWSGVGAFAIVLGTAIVVYLVSRKIEKVYADYDVKKVDLKPKEQATLFLTYKKRAQKYLWLSFAVIIGLWVAVKLAKVCGFSTVTSWTEVSTGLGIIVPLGISYYTLSAVGYVLEIYWRRSYAEHNFLNLLTAMIYFPHIMQGPISKYDDLIKQMKELPKLDYDRICFGLQLMLWGYVKKIIIADRLILYTNAVFTQQRSFAGIEIVIAVILCVIQLYADFSGCMDIIRGISQVIGIELAENFRQPFFAKSAQEFWSRWHMTLGTWTKDYIYIPIAMNAKFMKYTRTLKKDGKAWMSSFLKAFCPLASVWLFTGLWHGTGLDYLAWGFYWCMIMTLSKELKWLGDKVVELLSIDAERTYYQVWKMIRTAMFFGIGRMITVTGSLGGCLLLCRQLISEHRLWTLFDGSLYTHGLDQKDFTVTVVGMIVMLIVDVLHERGIEIRKTIADQILIVRWIVYYAVIIAIMIFGMYGPGYDASKFIYGAF